MATIKKTTKTTGNKTTTKVKDTSKLTGRQQVSREKAKTKATMSKNAAITATAGEAIAGATTIAGQHYDAQKAASRDRNRTYQEAINKWNGILKSTPESAEGTNPALEGTSNKQGSNNSTGTNPDVWSPSGW